MSGSQRSAIDLRPATLDDAVIVADLDSTFDPEDPRDPALVRFWWTRTESTQATMRWVDERDGRAIAFVGAGHDYWNENPERYGWLQPRLRYEQWSVPAFQDLVKSAETWLTSEGAAIAVTRFRSDQADELNAVGELGYKEVRRQNMSELDLESSHHQLVEEAGRQRLLMRERGIRMLTVDQDEDPESMHKLYEMSIAAERDIPTTMPWRTETFDEWTESWFSNPGVRKDRFWIAKDGDAVVGMSVLSYPPSRGLPWTTFTGTSPSARGRGIARALKYETIAQAVALGFKRVRTMNDGANAPILHVNGEMGYRLVLPIIELHRELAS